MEIMEQLTLLAELNELEVRLRKSATRLKELPSLADEAEREATKIKRRLDEMLSQRDEAARKQRSLESELASEKDHLRKWQKRLDNIKEEREHAALSSEIATQKRIIGRRENEILESMELLEKMDQEIGKVQADFDAADSTAKQEMEKVAADIDSENKSQTDGQKARDALLEKLPVPLVKRYQRIAERRQGQGVAILQGETCTACYNTVRPQLANQVYQGNVIETCNSCQRILVHESATRSTAVDEAVTEASA